MYLKVKDLELAVKIIQDRSSDKEYVQIEPNKNNTGYVFNFTDTAREICKFRIMSKEAYMLPRLDRTEFISYESYEKKEKADKKI